MRAAPLNERLLGWYRAHRRELPWRRHPTLYRTLLSEFLLQQTRLDQALPYYERFLARWPTMRALAGATLAEVVKAWEGLGYYHRAAHLHRTARLLAPLRRPTAEDLRGCPGVGPYTLAAVASIALGEPLPVLDGNVRRVASRFLALDTAPELPEGRKRIFAWLDGAIDRARPGEWNQAMMELGALVCTPRAPRCPSCPLRAGCRGFALGRADTLPIRKPRPVRPHRQIACAVIRRSDGRILIARRPPEGLLPNLWEFPGGKQEAGESIEETCVREVREELGVEVAIASKLAEIRHAYTHFRITLHAFDCRYRRGRPRALGCAAWRWVHPGKLREYPFPRANGRILEMLEGGPTP